MAGFFASFPSSGSGGVTSIDGMTGAITLIAGTGITITDGAGTITIAATGGGGGITSINGDTTAAQILSVGTAGTDFAIVDAGGGSHVFNLPTASASNRGALSSADWTTFNGKANTALSNLTTTAINQDLVWAFTGGATKTLETAVNGSSSITGDNLLLKSGNTGGNNSPSGNVSLKSGDAGNANSGALLIATGTVVSNSSSSGAISITTGNNGGASTSGSGSLSLSTGNVGGTQSSGNISLLTGTGGTTRGSISLKNGSEGTSGQIWTSTNTTGAGAWVASSGITALTGDVTATGPGSAAAVITSGAVSLAKMANLAANTIIGNNTGSPATPLALTMTQVTAMLNLFTTSLQGLVPASGGGTTNFLRADGTFAAPTGSGANTALSNLTATSINQSLLPGTSNSIDLGASNKLWSNLFIGSGGNGISLFNGLAAQGFIYPNSATPSGATAPSFYANSQATNYNIAVFTQNDPSVNASATGNVLVESGNKTAGTGNSGNINLTIGTSSGGVRGKISFKDGSEGTSGYVWTSTNTTGAGTWIAPSSGIPFNFGDGSDSTATLDGTNTYSWAPLQYTLFTVGDVAGSLSGVYFLVSSTTINYYVWFNVDGGSTDPAVAGRTGIEIDIGSGSDRDTVASAINGVFQTMTAPYIFLSETTNNEVIFILAVNGQPLSPLAAGTSGFTISSTVTYVMTRTAYLTNLIVNSGIVLLPGLYSIFGTGTLTNNGSIAANGGNADNAGVRGQGTGGDSGASGAFEFAGQQTTFENGGAAAGTLGAQGEPGNGTNGVPGIIGAGQLNTKGGDSGDGGSGTGGAGGAGQLGRLANGNPAASLNTGPAFDFRRLSETLLVSGFNFTVDNTAASGASGGGDGTNNGGGGGGGGGNGGIISIYFDTLINNGVISANAGNGGNGETPTTFSVGIGGGGGGGGGVGGILYIVSRLATYGTLQVSGGAGGAAGSGQGTGTAGTAGTAGTDGLIRKLLTSTNTWS